MSGPRRKGETGVRGVSAARRMLCEGLHGARGDGGDSFKTAAVDCGDGASKRVWDAGGLGLLPVSRQDQRRAKLLVQNQAVPESTCFSAAKWVGGSSQNLQP